MEQRYAHDDWYEIAGEQHGFIAINGVNIPYVTMNNEPESKDPEVLEHRYGEALNSLYKLWKEGS
jgi:hypothetical protein